jgi:hypothetical protein
MVWLWFHYKKPVDLWWFSRDILGKRHKHAQSVTITIFSSRFNIVGYEAHTFMTFSQIRNKKAHYIVAFFHIRHRWINQLCHSIKFVMDEEPIVQSAWTHLLYSAYVAWIYHVSPTCQICTKKTFFDYRNIILCHLGGPHVTLASGWPTCQLSMGWFF